MKRIVMFFILAPLVNLSNSQDLDDDAKYQSYLKYIQYDLKYAGAQIISFRQGSFKMALTSIHKTKEDHEKKKSPMHIAELDDKGDVFFRVYREECRVVEKILDVVLEVNDQRVAAAYYCGNKSSGPEIVYLIKSDKGRAYVNKEFAERKYVFTEFLSSPKIAFDTDGFLEASKKKTRPIY